MTVFGCNVSSRVQRHRSATMGACDILRADLTKKRAVMRPPVTMPAREPPPRPPDQAVGASGVGTTEGATNAVGCLRERRPRSRIGRAQRLLYPDGRDIPQARHSTLAHLRRVTRGQLGEVGGRMGHGLATGHAPRAAKSASTRTRGNASKRGGSDHITTLACGRGRVVNGHDPYERLLGCGMAWYAARACARSERSAQASSTAP
jgi:hypothetical protein